MSLFRRQQTATLEPPPVTAGTSLCDARGCANYTAVQCAYRDRRGRACTATFCPTHHVRLDDIVFCRRHANTVAALGDRGKDPNALPDIDDRGPSLDRVVRHLQRHSIAATTEESIGGDIPTAELLLSRASDIGADLLVAQYRHRDHLVVA